MLAHEMLLLAVYNDGRVCISILHSPGDDPHGFEKASERWSPVQSVYPLTLLLMVLDGTSLWSDLACANFSVC